MTDKERDQIAVLAAEVSGMRGEFGSRLDSIDNRLSQQERRALTLDADGDALRLEETKLRSFVEALPCSRNTVKIQRLADKVSTELKMVRTEGNTDRIDIARMEGEQSARKDFLTKLEAATDRATAATDRRWKRVAEALTLLITAAVGIGGYQCSVNSKESNDGKSNQLDRRKLDDTPRSVVPRRDGGVNGDGQVDRVLRGGPAKGSAPHAVSSQPTLVRQSPWSGQQGRASVGRRHRDPIAWPVILRGTR